MSLVKKLHPGGSIDSNALNDALNNELASLNLKSKDERKIRDALVQLIDFTATKGNTFSADELAQKYTISGEGSEKFQGSPDEIRSNWITGKLKIKDEQDAMSVAAAILGTASKNITPSTPTEKEKLGIGQLSSFVTDEIYGTPEAFATDFHKITSNEDRKKKVMEFAKTHINKYLQLAAQNKDNVEFKDLDKVQAMKAALDTGDWDKFTTSSYGVKWNPNEFLVQPDERETFAAEEEQHKQEVANIAAKTGYESLVSKGFTPEMAQEYATHGFTKILENRPTTWKNKDVSPQFNQYLKDKGAIILKNPATGGERIVTPDGSELNLSGEEFNEFSPMYGLAWQHNPQTGALQFIPTQYKKPNFGNVGVGLSGTVPGYENWKITGWSGTQEPAEGTRDYTKTLVLEQGGRKVYLDKGADNLYHTRGGAALAEQPSITGYTNARTNIARYDQLYPLLYDSKEVVPSNYDYTEDLATVNEAVRTKETGITKGPVAQAATRLISALMYNPRFQSNTELKISIMNLLSDYHNALSAREAKPVKETSWFKEGGILKLQEGGATSAKLDAYIKKMSSTPTAPTATKAPEKWTDISGTWKDMGSAEKGLRALSIAGAAGSFAPVPIYGMIGAGVTLGADIAADITKDGFQASDIMNWNTAANAGFVVLSAIGLGGVRALVKAGKVAKGTSEIAETASKAKKYATALGIGVEDSNALNKVVKLADKIKAKTPEELLAKIKQLKSVSPKAANSKAYLEHVSTLEKGLDVLNSVSASPVPLLGSFTARSVVKGAGKGLSKTMKALNSKTLRTGLRVAAVAPGVPALYKTAKTGFTEGWEYTKPEDFKKIAYAGGFGRTWAKDFRGVRALTRQTPKVVAGADKTIITLGKEKIEIDQAITPPVAKGRLKGAMKGDFTKESLGKLNEAEFAKYKEKLSSAAKEKGIVISKEELKNIKPEHVEVTYSEETPGTILGAAPMATGRGRAIDVRDYKLAKKYTEKFDGTVATKTPEPTPAKVSSKALTPEQRAKLKVLDETKIPSKSISEAITNKELMKEIKIRKKIIADAEKDSKKVSPLARRTLAKREQQLKDYIKEYRNVKTKLKDGGILKYQKPASSIVKRPSTLKNLGLDYNAGIESKRANTFEVPYQSNTSANYYGGVTNELIAKNWNPELLKSAGFDPSKYNTWGLDAPKKLQEYIKSNRGDLYRQLKDPTSKTSNLFGIDWYTLGMNPISKMQMKGVKIPLKPVGGKPASGNLDIKKQTGVLPTLWNSIKGELNPTSLANLAMYANTINTNRQMGIAQRKAIADSLYNLPAMSQTYLRIDKPNTLLAEKQAGRLRSQAGRIARSTSDLNRSTAVQLQGGTQAEDLIAKGQQSDLNRADKLREMQLTNKMQVDQTNLNILGKNRALTAEAAKNLNLINANQMLAQNTAFSNFVRAGERNLGVNKYKSAMEDYWKMSNDPTLRAKSEAYQKEAGEEGYAAAEKAYNKAKADYAGTDYAKTFEESKEYTDWQQRVKNLESSLNLSMEPLRQKQSWIQNYYPLLYMKKGGSLTREDKIAIEREKFNNQKRLKDTEMEYKIIMHNNEMLQKALIKVFK